MNIIYTAMCGDYDTPNPVLKPTKGWRYIYFTDNPDLRVPGWEMILLDGDHAPKIKAKLPKILPHRYLPTHDTSVWIDAAYSLKGNIELLTKPFKHDIGLMIHSGGRKDVYDEADTVLKYGLDSAELVTKIVDKYKSEGVPGTYGNNFYQASIIIRKNCEKVNNFNQAWCDEIMNSSTRDQLSLPYCLNLHNLSVYKMTHLQSKLVMDWTPHKKHVNNIFFIQPYGFQLKIGDRLNYEIDRMPENAWVCLTDQDTCFLTPKVGDLLNNIIARYPDTSLFSAYTNRLGLDYQKWPDVDYENLDMLYHHKIAEEKLKQYYSTCVDINKPVAGFFMMFPKKTWEAHEFQTEIIDRNKVLNGHKGVYFDYDFSYRVLKSGGKIRLIQGLYLYHHYRINKDRKDVKHLTTVV